MVCDSLPIHKAEDETRDTCDAFELTGSTASFPGSPEGPTPRRRKLPSVYEPLRDSQVLRVVSRTTARRWLRFMYRAFTLLLNRTIPELGKFWNKTNTEIFLYVNTISFLNFITDKYLFMIEYINEIFIFRLI